MGFISREMYALRKAIRLYLSCRNSPELMDEDYAIEYKGKGYGKWIKTERDRLLQFKDKHLGEDCFIIGNGPSLNKMDLSVLNEYYTFGLNKIFLIFERVKLELSYLVSVNPLVIEQSREEYMKMDIPIFLSSVKNEYNISKSNIYSLYTKSRWGFYTNPLSGMSEGYTVTYVALQLAYYMGFKNVFLVGVDHNFEQKGNPNEMQKMEGRDENHFDPKYFTGQNWHLADLEASEISYSFAKRFFEQANRQIYDATVDGKLNVYKKIKFEESLNIAKKKRLLSQ